MVRLTSVVAFVSIFIVLWVGWCILKKPQLQEGGWHCTEEGCSFIPEGCCHDSEEECRNRFTSKKSVTFSDNA